MLIETHGSYIVCVATHGEKDLVVGVYKHATVTVQRTMSRLRKAKKPAPAATSVRRQRITTSRNLVDRGSDVRSDVLQGVMRDPIRQTKQQKSKAKMQKVQEKIEPKAPKVNADKKIAKAMKSLSKNLETLMKQPEPGKDIKNAVDNIDATELLELDRKTQLVYDLMEYIDLPFTNINNFEMCRSILKMTEADVPLAHWAYHSMAIQRYSTLVSDFIIVAARMAKILKLSFPGASSPAEIFFSPEFDKEAFAKELLKNIGITDRYEDIVREMTQTLAEVGIDKNARDILRMIGFYNDGVDADVGEMPTRQAMLGISKILNMISQNSRVGTPRLFISLICWLIFILMGFLITPDYKFFKLRGKNQVLRDTAMNPTNTLNRGLENYWHRSVPGKEKYYSDARQTFLKERFQDLVKTLTFNLTVDNYETQMATTATITNEKRVTIEPDMVTEIENFRKGVDRNSQNEVANILNKIKAFKFKEEDGEIKIENSEENKINIMKEYLEQYTKYELDFYNYGLKTFPDTPFITLLNKVFKSTGLPAFFNVGLSNLLDFAEIFASQNWQNLFPYTLIETDKQKKLRDDNLRYIYDQISKDIPGYDPVLVQDGIAAFENRWYTKASNFVFGFMDFAPIMKVLEFGVQSFTQYNKTQRRQTNVTYKVDGSMYYGVQYTTTSNGQTSSTTVGYNPDSAGPYDHSFNVSQNVNINTTKGYATPFTTLAYGSDLGVVLPHGRISGLKENLSNERVCLVLTGNTFSIQKRSVNVFQQNFAVKTLMEYINKPKFRYFVDGMKAIILLRTTMDYFTFSGYIMNKFIYDLLPAPMYYGDEDIVNVNRTVLYCEEGNHVRYALDLNPFPTNFIYIYYANDLLTNLRYVPQIEELQNYYNVLSANSNLGVFEDVYMFASAYSKWRREGDGVDFVVFCRGLKVLQNTEVAVHQQEGSKWNNQNQYVQSTCGSTSMVYLVYRAREHLDFNFSYNTLANNVVQNVRQIFEKEVDFFFEDNFNGSVFIRKQNDQGQGESYPGLCITKGRHMVLTYDPLNLTLNVRERIETNPQNSSISAFIISSLCCSSGGNNEQAQILYAVPNRETNTPTANVESNPVAIFNEVMKRIQKNKFNDKEAQKAALAGFTPVAIDREEMKKYFQSLDKKSLDDYIYFLSDRIDGGKFDTFLGTLQSIAESCISEDIVPMQKPLSFACDRLNLVLSHLKKPMYFYEWKAYIDLKNLSKEEAESYLLDFQKDEDATVDFQENEDVTVTLDVGPPNIVTDTQRNLKFEVVEVEGDGNCLFRSILKGMEGSQLEGSELTPEAMREAIIDTIEASDDDDKNAELERLKATNILEPDNFPTETSCKFASQRFNVHLVCYAINSGPYGSNEESSNYRIEWNESAEKTIYIVNKARVHFDALKAVQNDILEY